MGMGKGRERRRRRIWNTHECDKWEEHIKGKINFMQNDKVIGKEDQ